MVECSKSLLLVGSLALASDFSSIDRHSVILPGLTSNDFSVVWHSIAWSTKAVNVSFESRQCKCRYAGSVTSLLVECSRSLLCDVSSVIWHSVAFFMRVMVVDEVGIFNPAVHCPISVESDLSFSALSELTAFAFHVNENGFSGAPTTLYGMWWWAANISQWYFSLFLSVIAVKCLQAHWTFYLHDYSQACYSECG